MPSRPDWLNVFPTWLAQFHERPSTHGVVEPAGMFGARPSVAIGLIVPQHCDPLRLDGHIGEATSLFEL